MPIPPYAWQLNDFVTAYRLNSELRRTGGQPFLPNGTGWHASRPVFKTFTNVNLPAVSSSWQYFYASNATTWQSTADTGFFAGAKLDEGNNGQINGADLLNGSATSGNAGGTALLTHVTPFGTASGNTVKAGTAYYNGSAWTQFSQGTVQPTNGGQGCNPFALDLVDIGGVWTSGTRWTGMFSAASGGPAWNSHNTDGSGTQTRMAAFWAGGDVGSPTIPAGVPTITPSYSPTTPLTSAALNAQLQQTMLMLNNPPLLRASPIGGSATSVPNSANTVITYPTPTPGGNSGIDNYNGFNTSTNAYTCPLAGLYLVAAFTAWSSMSSGSVARTGVTVGGTNYSGANSISGGSAMTTAKVQVFNCAAGTQIQHYGFQASGGTISTANAGAWNGSYMVIVYLGPAVTPSPLPTVPDITYLFQAGTPASQMPAVLTNYLANDLSFLVGRPYLQAVQGSAQTGIAMGTDTALTGLTASSDNYAGFASNTYTAQRAGWYLAVQETFMAAPSLGSGSQCAGFIVNPAGSVSADRYQQQNAWTGNGGGAAAVGIYYLRAGDTIQPSILSQATSSTTTSTFVSGAGGQSHFELVWLSS